MSTAGKVLEVSDKVLKMERTLKGKTETMDFSWISLSPISQWEIRSRSTISKRTVETC